MLRAGLEVGKPNNIPAKNKQTSNGHSHRGQRKRTRWTTRRTRGPTTQMNTSTFSAIYVRCWCVQSARTIPGSYWVKWSNSTRIRFRRLLLKVAANWRSQRKIHRHWNLRFFSCRSRLTMPRDWSPRCSFRLDFFSLYHFIGLCRSAAKSLSSFLLFGRWLPDTKKKKTVLVPRSK